eukprot:CAMPEP_0170556474 /NCGR_PEP_ID=MMETSP0211-20121228/17016_1 /TAXON_ID=311385 /ORGANISM="Pseudokeronopsis sp., Strain OXSARD2" /LENGTH=46 /DNA_ID= /DNA_START= /DNA_END= /DNA_ORIENTATION=
MNSFTCKANNKMIVEKERIETIPPIAVGLVCSGAIFLKKSKFLNAL